MALQCEYCQKTFPTNTSLYKHKDSVHSNSNLALVNNTSLNPRTQTFPDQDDLRTPTQLCKQQRADSGIRKKRKTPEKDYSINDFDNHQNYDDLKIIGSHEDIPEQIHKPYTIGIDKSLDMECEEEKKRVDHEFCAKFLDTKKSYISDATHLQRKTADDLHRMQSQHNKEMQDKQLIYDKQQSDLGKLKDAQCDERVKQIKHHCEEEKKKIREKFKKQLADEENESSRKLKMLNDQIKSLQEDDENLESLTKSIFNHNTMNEISEIQRLVKNHRVDVVVQKHLPTLQNLFLSLSYGILPTCQPQKEQVSDEQRELMEKMQTASRQAVKKLVKGKHSQVINLFTIIDGSLKLARNTFNRYGNAP